jgi:hypothetical protein
VQLTPENIRQDSKVASISFATSDASCLIKLVNPDNRSKADLVGKVAKKGPVTAGVPDHYYLQVK